MDDYWQSRRAPADRMSGVRDFIGGAMVLAGLWMFAGRTLYAGTFERFAARIGNPNEVTMRGFFLYGLAYGAASISCTLPLFLGIVGSGFAAGGLALGVGQFFAYALGMASVVLALTLALAFFKQGLVKRLRGAMPYVQLASAALLVLAGVYLILWNPTLGGTRLP